MPYAVTMATFMRVVALASAGPRTTVDLSLAADSCRVHIVVHDSGSPDDEPASAANRPERRFKSRLRSAR